VLQCVAVRCSVWQCVAVCCSVWQCVAVCGSVLQCDEPSKAGVEREEVLVLQCVTVFCCFSQCKEASQAVCCSVLQRDIVYCSVLPCVAA